MYPFIMNDEYEPSNAGNFLDRYHSWRDSVAKAQKSAPRSPPAKKAENVWSNVFQPYGRSPTGASRYDKSVNISPGVGASLSEIHDISKMKTINLDEPKE